MDLTSRLQSFFNNRKKIVSPIPSSQQVQSPSLIQNITNTISKPINQGIRNVSNFLNSNQSIELPRVPQQLNPSFKIGVRNTPYQLDIKPVEIARDIVNEPFSWGANLLSDRIQGQVRQAIGAQPLSYDRVKSPASRLDMNIQQAILPRMTQGLGVRNTPQEILGNIGGTLSGPLSVWGGGRILKTLPDAANLAGKRVLPIVLKRELGKGATAGGAYGFAAGLEDGRQGDVLDQLMTAAQQGIGGALVGGAAGGALGSGGYVLGSARNRILDLLGKKGIRGKAAEDMVYEFARDEFGRFTGRKIKVETPTPEGLFNNMLSTPDAPTPPSQPISSATFSPARGRQSSLAKSRITPEMRREFRRELGLPEDGLEMPQMGLSVKEVDSQELIPQARPGDFSNSRELDPRVAPEFKKRDDLLRESGLVPSNAPEGKRIQDTSVIDDIKSGFKGGRKAREMDEAAAKGGLRLRARSQLLDRLSPVFDFVNKAGRNLPAEENPYKRMRLLAGVSGKAEAFIDTKFSPILKKESDRLDDLSSLLVLDRERELIGRGFERKRNLDQINQGYEELRAKFGDEGFTTLRQSADEIRKVGNELLDSLKEAGIVDDESYNAIRRNNEFYAPFEAVEHMADNLEKGMGTGSYNVASQDVVKRIGNYTGDVADPLETLIRKIPKVIALTEKNKAIKSLVDLRKDVPDIYQNLIIPVKGDSKPDGMGIINVFENGQNKRYAVPDVVESAVKNLDAETGGILVSLGSIQARMLRAGATGLNIGFIPVNIVRDVQDSLTTEISENGVKAMLSFLGSYPRAIFAAARKDDLYKQWMKAGGAQSTMTEQVFKNTPKTIAELAGKKPLKTKLNPIKGVAGLIDFANRVGEQSTRLARFQSGLKRGETLDEAAFKSRDISLDFAKAGNSIKVLNQVIPFLNASIQGSEKLLRLYRNNPKAAVASTSILFGVPTVALFTHNQQFQDYDDIPDAEKQTNWIILARDRTEEERTNGDSPIGIKIPKGFMGRITSTSVESALQFMKTKDPSSFAKAAVDTGASISPVGLPLTEERIGQTLSTILPPWIKAGVEWTTNNNLFFGSDIVPQSLQNLPPSEQYKDKTPGIYKVAGKLTGLSPLKIENTVNTTTGGLGRQIATGLSGDLEGGTLKQVSRRFMDIRDGKKTEEAYDVVEKEKQYTALRNKQLKEAARKEDWDEVRRLSKGMTSQQINSLIRNDMKKEQKKALTPEQRAFETLSKEEQRRLQSTRPELKTELDIIPGADASEYDFTSELSDDVETSAIKVEVESTGKPKWHNDTYYYINENGNVASVSKDFTVEEPEYTGNAQLDKELKSDYKSELSKKQNNIVKLYKLGQLTKDEAADALGSLEVAKGGGKGRKTPQINFQSLVNKLDFKPIQVRRTRSGSRRARSVPPRITPPQVKQLKFNGKPLTLKKSK